MIHPAAARALMLAAWFSACFALAVVFPQSFTAGAKCVFGFVVAVLLLAAKDINRFGN